MFGCLRRAANEGTCCLVATHNRDVAPFLDEVLVIENGRLEDDTAPVREVSA